MSHESLIELTFDSVSEDGRMIPIIATRGNHEKSNEMIHKLFDVPSESIYYGLTMGDDFIRTYVLNTEISISGEQSIWLKNDLKKHKKIRWKIAQYQKPMRAHVESKPE